MSVEHEPSRGRWLDADAELNATGGGIFDGVGEKIGENLLDARGVGLHQWRHTRLNDELAAQAAFGGEWLKIAQSDVRESRRGKSNPAHRQLAGLQRA